MTHNVGFIGLGAIGAGVCSHTAASKSFNVTAFDLDTARVDEAVSAGATAAKTIADVAKAAQIIVLALPNPRIVRSVCEGDAGLVAQAQSGSFIFDLSTNDAETSRALAQEFQAKGVIYIDAPHSGGKGNAANGTLPLILGATAEEVASCLPLLEHISSSIHYVEQRGAASVIKLVNNVMSMGNLLVAAEAFTLGVKAGVDAGTLFNVIQYCGGSSQRLIKRFPAVLDGDFKPQFTVDLAEKDLALVMEAAQRLHVPMLMGAACHQFYQLTSRSGRGGGDVTAVVEYLEELTGASLRGEYKVADVRWA